MKLKTTNTQEVGSTLVVALVSVLVVAMVTGHILLRITAQMETANRSAAWNEALTTAESAVDMTVSDLTAVLPDVRVNSGDGLNIGDSQLKNPVLMSLGVGSSGLSLQPGVPVTFTPLTLRHGGEGAGQQEATVTLDVVPLSQLLGSGALQFQDSVGLLANPLAAITGGDLQLVHLRARGTVAIRSQRGDRDPLDSELRRATLVWDRLSRARATQAAMTREVEVYLKPVFPFQSAITASGALDSPSSNATFDSFNSLLTAASTNGLYDPSKKLSNGDINVYDSRLNLAGTVLGDVRTSGAYVVKTDRISGIVDNSCQKPLPLIRAPLWNRTPQSPGEVIGSTTLAAGLPGAPTRYKFDRITSSLQITGALGLDTNVEIWVTGDVTGSIRLDPGVRAKVYVQGNVSLDANCLVNSSNRAANLMIFGLPADVSGSSAREIRLGLGDLCAGIYAPTHNVRLVGNGHFQGAITSASFVTEGDAHVHFDEALALNVGPTIRFEVASWSERRL